MVVPVFLETVEQTGFSTWLRETQSVFGFYFVLTFHTFGLVLLVGPSAAIDLRILGVGSQIQLAPLKKCYKLMWMGFVLNAVSGLLLVYAYPTKALTNPVFYIKLMLIGLAVWTMQRLKTQVFGDLNLNEAAMEARGKYLAIWSLVLWVGAITAGRLLAYTYTYLVYGFFAPGG